MQWIVSALLLVNLFAGVAFGAEPIKIGAVLPLNDVTGKQSAAAMKLAVAEINRAGGVLGRPLSLIIADDEMKAEKGAAAIEKLAIVDKVDIFVGGMSSSVHLAQIPLLKKYKKVTVWAGAASSLCEEMLENEPWYFHLHLWDYMQGQQYFKGWGEIKKKYPKVKLQRWFFAYEDGAYGSSAYKHYLGVTPPADWKRKGAYFKSAASGQADYRDVLRRAMVYKPDIFIMVGYEGDALPIMQQSRQLGFAPPIFAGASPGWPPHFGQSPLAENVCIYSFWSPSMKNVSKVAGHFWHAYKKEFNAEPTTYFAPLAYSNIYIVAEAIKKSGSIENQALIKALEATRYESPLGDTIVFRPSKIAKHQGTGTYKIFQWQKGVLQVIWPFEMATASFRYPYKH
ncbi:MAG: ABC transporter substrate-binding protein [Syntrophus sp. (in: bacteria)]